MTTIACNREEMAADSRTSDDAVFYTTAGKITRVGNNLVGCCGNLDSIAKFLTWFRKKKKPKDCPEFSGEDFEAIVLSPGGMFMFANSCQPRRIVDEFYATGSGGMAALAALRCGKSPAEAVAIAILCDKNSGGPVVVERLPADA